jgi:hypothetical protein
MSQSGAQQWVSGEQRPPLPDRKVLSRPETESSDFAKGTRWPIANPAPERLRAILDNRFAFSSLVNTRHVAHVPKHMHGNHGIYFSAFLMEILCRQAVCFKIDVDKPT